MTVAIDQNGSSAKVANDRPDAPHPDRAKAQGQRKADDKGPHRGGRKIAPNNDQNSGDGGNERRTPPGSPGAGGAGGKLQGFGGAPGENGGGSLQVADPKADRIFGLDRVEPQNLGNDKVDWRHPSPPPIRRPPPPGGRSPPGRGGNGPDESGGPWYPPVMPLARQSIPAPPPPGPQATDGDSLVANYDLTQPFHDLNALKGQVFDEDFANLDKSFITPDSINQLNTLILNHKIALLGQYLKMRDAVEQAADAFKKVGTKFLNEQKLLDNLNNGVTKIEADSDIQGFMSGAVPENVNVMLARPENAGTLKGLEDQYTTLIVNGGLFAEAKRDGLSPEETMKAYSLLVGQFGTYLPDDFLNASGRDTAGALAGYIESLAPTDPSAYDALLYRVSADGPPLPKDVTDAFNATYGTQLGPLYARAFGASVAAAADQILAQIPPGSLSVTPQEAHAKIAADLAKTAADRFKMLRGGLKVQDAYNGLIKIAQEKMDWGAGFLKPTAESAINQYKTGIMHVGNALLDGMALVAKYAQDGKLATGDSLSISGLVGQSMSFMGLMAEGFAKDLGTDKPFFGDVYKRRLASLVRPGDIENGGKVLGAIGGYLSAALGFVSAVQSGNAGDIPGAVINSLSAANGVLGSSTSLTEAGLNVLDGSKTGAAAIASALGYAGDAAELAQATKVILSVIGRASGVIGGALTVGMMIYDIIESVERDAARQKEWDANVRLPLRSLTGLGFEVELAPTKPGGGGRRPGII